LGLVDDIHWLGGVLVQRVAGLKRGPAMISLLKLADQAEPLRHAVQHLDGEIEVLRRLRGLPDVRIGSP
jgi:hypothetical protein